MTTRSAIRRPDAPTLGHVPAMVALVLGAAAMGLSPVLVRLADVGPYSSAFWRTALALPVLWAWMRIAERGSPPGSRTASFSLPIIYSGLSFGADLFFWHTAIVHTTVANATFFATLAPLWVVIFGWLLLGERVGGAVLAGLATCLVGGTALVWQSLTAAPEHVMGDAFGIVTGVCFGLYFLAVRAARRRAGAARVTFEMTVVAAALLGVVAIVFEHRLFPQSVGGWAVLLSLALVSHTGGQGLLSVALGALPAVFSSLVIFLEAIIAALVAWAVLGEPVTGVQAAGAVLIVAGIFVARPREKDHTVSE